MEFTSFKEIKKLMDEQEKVNQDLMLEEMEGYHFTSEDDQNNPL